ncbi:hypothetical protein [Candidatus Nitrosotenuis cloacae]|jgi:hypothetical protein|uniref:hypothetical protein n=1 Tax=Candidatus Nitrosotenuis cloacae TaxID=1603555 RepID=UPI00227E0A7E|nr:hypothetical protein [Candidatus Nitrosotenuis cloacae]
MSRYRYWKLTADEIASSQYDPSKVLNWEIKGIKEPEDEAIFIGVFLYRNGTPLGYESVKGMAFYHNNVKKDEVSEVTKMIKDKFGGSDKQKGDRVLFEGSKEIYSGKEIGQLAKDLESKFNLRAVISIEFKEFSEEERKASGLADAKLLPIPGKN